jgi:hypothetical protein
VNAKARKDAHKPVRSSERALKKRPKSVAPESFVKKKIQTDADSKDACPARNEWAMFQDCPEEERKTCLTYEYCRELPRIPPIVAKWRASADWRKLQKDYTPARLEGVVAEAFHLPEPTLNVIAELFHLSEPAVPGHVLVMLMGLRDFPKRPFLAIAEEERKRWLLPRGDLIICEWNPKLLCGVNGQPRAVNTVRTKGGKAFTFVVCGIPWEQSNGAILAAFEKWLVEMRGIKIKKQERDLLHKKWLLDLSKLTEQERDLLQSEEPKFAESEFAETEARGSNELRSDLKKLGALRLLRSMTWDDAETHTQNVLGYPLYSRDSAWERARREAEKSLREFSSFAPPTGNG